MKTIIYHLSILLVLSFSAFAQIAEPPYADLSAESLETDTMVLVPWGYARVDLLFYNLGDGPSTANYMDVSLSSTPTGGSGYSMDLLLAPAVAPHGVVPGTVYAPVPPSVPAGLYYIRITVNYTAQVPETDRSNNVVVVPCFVRPLSFDMALSFLDTSTLHGYRNTTLTTLLKEENLGEALVFDHQVSYYLSTDTVFSYPDDFGLGADNLNGLEFEDRIREVSLRIPDNAPLGEYYFLAIYTDYRVTEPNTDNNIAYRKIVIGETDVDLKISSIVPLGGNASSSPNTSFYVTTYETTAGFDSVPAHQVGFYLSHNNVYDVGDIFLAKNNVEKYKGGNTYGFQTQFRFPATLEEGSYFLLAVTDVDGQVTELNEYNNVFALPFNILAGAKDFSIAELSSSGSPLFPGSALRLHVVEKIRPFSPCAHHTAFFLSADSLYSVNDQYLHSDLVFGSDTVTSRTWQPILYLPEPLAAGSYFIVAVADFGDECIEHIESNNTRALQIHILPDISTGILFGHYQHAEGMKVYPNPSTGICKLGSSEGIDRVEVYDARGRSVLGADVDAGLDHTLDLRHLEAGVYVVKALSDKTTIGYQRLVIQK